MPTRTALRSKCCGRGSYFRSHASRDRRSVPGTIHTLGRNFGTCPRRNGETPVSDIHVESADKILILSFARPSKKNAITDAMYGTLADELEAAETDPDVRVVLIRGEGDAFTAGNDLADFAAVNAGTGSAVRNVERFLRALTAATRPIVAAVQGLAVGVGTTLLLHCDYVLLGEGAVLTTPFVNLALVPAAASSLLLPLRIGHARAFETFVLGEPINAQTAVQWGIANR